VRVPWASHGGSCRRDGWRFLSVSGAVTVDNSSSINEWNSGNDAQNMGGQIPFPNRAVIGTGQVNSSCLQPDGVACEDAAGTLSENGGE
jgi:hypothetical protein